MNALLDDLCWRGLIAHSTDLEALGAHMDEGPVKFYVGFDPTAPSLHMGNLVQLLFARRLQQAGHKPHLLVGGATGQIGDPKETGERVMNSREVVAGWVERIRAQAERFVSFEGDNAAVMVNNLDWTAGMSVLDFLRDVGKHFPVNRMLARDVVARRLESGIATRSSPTCCSSRWTTGSCTGRHGVTLQHGGSDQWGNITAGVELLRRSDQVRAHALATPLLTKADGTKFGKTESGTVWLDRELTSPYAFHQFFLNAEDAKVVDYLKVFSFRTREEIEVLEKATENEPHKRLAQKALADDITDIVHGIEERRAVVTAAAALFGRGDLSGLSEETLRGIMRELKAPEVKLPISLVDAFLVSGIVESKAAARRAVLEGGAYLNNEKITDPEFTLTADDLLGGRCAIVRRGRRTVGGVQIGMG